MKLKNILLDILILGCLVTAAGASVGKQRPISDELMKWILFMSANIDLPAPAPAAEPEPRSPDPVVFKRTITSAPLSSQGLYITNLAEADVNIDELLSMPPEAIGAEVLILHTHGCEAYTPSEQYSYTPSSDFRTTDKSFNVVRVGNEIQQCLEAAGVKVIHDTTLCDDPDFNKSYSRSYSIAKKYLEDNPNIKVILDVHRDSIAGENGEQIKTAATGGVSQLMFVVGTDTGGAEHPLWRQNLSFALNLQKRLIAIDPNLMRPINLRSSRFNQQLSTSSLILEVGSDGNTLEEALGAARIFGDELGKYLTGRS